MDPLLFDKTRNEFAAALDELQGAYNSQVFATKSLQNEIDRLRKLVIDKDKEICRLADRIAELKKQQPEPANLGPSCGGSSFDPWKAERERIVEKIDWKKFRRLQVGEYMHKADQWLDHRNIWRKPPNYDKITNSTAIVLRKINSCGCDDVST